MAAGNEQEAVPTPLDNDLVREFERLLIAPAPFDQRADAIKWMRKRPREAHAALDGIERQVGLMRTQIPLSVQRRAVE